MNERLKLATACLLALVVIMALASVAAHGMQRPTEMKVVCG